MNGNKHTTGLIILAMFASIFSFGQVNEHDDEGKKHGEWVKYYERSSVPRYEGQFNHGRPVGKFTYRYPSSKIRSIVIHERDSPRSEAYFYHENKELLAHGIYKNQKKDSVWTHFRPSGHLSFKETYENGQLNGKRTTYYGPNVRRKGEPAVLREAHYENDRLNGPVIEYFPDGIVKLKGKYKQGRFDGKIHKNHPNGRTMILERWKNRQKHGWWITYDEQGKELGRAYYRHGERLEGEELKKYMNKLKKEGKNPNG